MKNPQILLINLINLAILLSTFFYFILGNYALEHFIVGFHLVYLVAMIIFTIFILYCAYTEKTIPYNKKRINARQMTITLGVLFIILLVNSLVLYSQDIPQNVLIRSSFSTDIIFIIILYCACGILSIIAGILLKKKQ